MDPGDGYERFPHPSLMNSPSINSPKRGYSQVDRAPSTEMVHIIVAQMVRIDNIELDAELYGMSFLSEFPLGAGCPPPDVPAPFARPIGGLGRYYRLNSSSAVASETDFTNTQRNISRTHRYTAHALESWGSHPVGEDDTPYAPPPLPPPRLAPINLSGTSRGGIWVRYKHQSWLEEVISSLQLTSSRHIIVSPPLHANPEQILRVRIESAER